MNPLPLLSLGVFGKLEAFMTILNHSKASFGSFPMHTKVYFRGEGGETTKREASTKGGEGLFMEITKTPKAIPQKAKSVFPGITK